MLGFTSLLTGVCMREREREIGELPFAALCVPVVASILPGTGSGQLRATSSGQISHILEGAL